MDATQATIATTTSKTTSHVDRDMASFFPPNSTGDQSEHKPDAGSNRDRLERISKVAPASAAVVANP